MFVKLKDVSKDINMKRAIAHGSYTLLPMIVNREKDRRPLPKNYQYLENNINELFNEKSKYNHIISHGFEEDLSYLFGSKAYFDYRKLRELVERLRESTSPIYVTSPPDREKYESIAQTLSAKGFKGMKTTMVLSIIEYGIPKLVSDDGIYRDNIDLINRLMREKNGNVNGDFRVVHPQEYYWSLMFDTLI